jgi:hypothetical protein
MDRCIAWGKAHGPPERPNQTIWEVFEEERPKLIPYRGRFDGFHALALNRGSHDILGQFISFHERKALNRRGSFV